MLIAGVIAMYQMPRYSTTALFITCQLAKDKHASSYQGRRDDNFKAWTGVGVFKWNLQWCNLDHVVLITHARCLSWGMTRLSVFQSYQWMFYYSVQDGYIHVDNCRVLQRII